MDRDHRTDSELQALRDQLGELDRKLFDVVAERQRLATEIGRLKAASGRATRDYRQEKDVIERAERIAADLDITPGFARDLTLLLIRESLTAQEQDRVHEGARGDGRNVLLIGGNGRMGQWLARFLSSQSFSVEVADPTGAPEGLAHIPDWRASLLDHDMIIVATPLRLSNEVLEQLAERRPRGVVFDVSSLKTPLRSGLYALKEAGVRVTSIHPMFGPDTQMLSGRHVVFVDLGIPEATATARELFESTMVVQADMDLESHDRLMAYILGLSHATNIAFFTALAESGEAAPRLAHMSSTTFDAQLDLATRVAGDNPQLYYEIQSLNAYGGEALAALADAVERIRSVIRTGDPDAFVAMMMRGRQYLRGRGKEAGTD
jgi:chorismate mutase/prephenate dehydrogenase